MIWGFKVWGLGRQIAKTMLSIIIGTLNPKPYRVLPCHGFGFPHPHVGFGVWEGYVWAGVWRFGASGLRAD